MRLWIAGAALISVIALVAFVPPITAQRTEFHRHQQLDSLAEPSLLPVCPAGDSLDAFLDRVTLRTIASLWIPACREQPFATGRVLLVLTSRAGFASCNQQLSRQSHAACALEERLAFLQNAAATRSVARVKIPDSTGRATIWITSQPLAWGDALVAEHRLYLVLALCALAFSGLLGLTGRHARSTYSALRCMRVAGPLPPKWAEFWLLFVLPPYAQSLPVDYRDEYEERLLREGEVHAGRWYRYIIYASLRDLIFMRLQRALPLLSKSSR